jgi:hypothetical protein
MAKGLNFRHFSQPTLPINMNDKEETLFTLVAPSVALVEKLEANQQTIVETFQKGDRESLEALWSFAAELISCNREHRHVTAAELKDRYGMGYAMLLAFFVAYEEFIHEIEAAKN